MLAVHKLSQQQMMMVMSCRSTRELQYCTGDRNGRVLLLSLMQAAIVLYT
jgi:hypothetical protein